MSDIELVIKIPENTYRQIQALARNGYFEHDICGNSMRRIANGKPLPKHHGRLIECEPIYDKLIRSYRADEKDYPERGKDYRVGLSNAIDLLINAPTIIETK